MIDIPEAQFESIRAGYHELANFHFDRWVEAFKNTDWLPAIEKLHSTLGDAFAAKAIADIYETKDSEAIKFLAMLIWGYSSAGYGPHRARAIFDTTRLTEVLVNVNVSSIDKIVESYELHKRIHGIGPAFFTKHLYFIGLANKAELIPVIFDNQVAAGLLRLACGGGKIFELVQVTPKISAEAYRDYVLWCNRQASLINAAGPTTKAINAGHIERHIFELGATR